ncbi:hypothetical protein Y032_0480g2241 [Ancylostoma ceylanicum]|uniref:Uncharacterized protein n=1 Tax=Ancylostoma ceylanicum TaxID=53326 RepID=A0A016WVW7_9BILA|nr:hypothetical protein Y032_0480g2241 [Ancylostoma ceylanicum]
MHHHVSAECFSITPSPTVWRNSPPAASSPGRSEKSLAQGHCTIPTKQQRTSSGARKLSVVDHVGADGSRGGSSKLEPWNLRVIDADCMV